MVHRKPACIGFKTKKIKNGNDPVINIRNSACQLGETKKKKKKQKTDDAGAALLRKTISSKQHRRVLANAVVVVVVGWGGELA